MDERPWTGRVTRDRRLASVVLPGPDGEGMILQLDGVANVERLIHTLSELRARMIPVVSPTPIEGEVVLTDDPTDFLACAERRLGMRHVLLRHPALGWLGFLFDEPRASVLAAALTAPDQTRSRTHETPSSGSSPGRP